MCDDNRQFHFVPQPWVGLDEAPALWVGPQGARRRCLDPTVWGLRGGSPQPNSQSKDLGRRAPFLKVIRFSSFWFWSRVIEPLTAEIQTGWALSRNGSAQMKKMSMTLARPLQIWEKTFLNFLCSDEPKKNLNWTQKKFVTIVEGAIFGGGPTAQQFFPVWRVQRKNWGNNQVNEPLPFWNITLVLLLLLRN